MDRYELHRVRVRQRSDDRYRLKPGMEALEGRELTVRVLWRIQEDESDLYAGEWALGAAELEPFGITWIASGDVEVLTGQTLHVH